MKKFLLTFLMAGATLVSPAITSQDLDGKIVCQLFFGNTYQPGPVLSAAGKFSVENGQLYIRNFRARYKLPVTLSNNKLVLPLLTDIAGEDPQSTAHQACAIGATLGKHYDDRYGNPLTTVNGYHAACYQIYDDETSTTTAYSTAPYLNIGLPNFVNKPGFSLFFEMEGTAGTSVAIYKEVAFFILDGNNAKANDSNGQEYEMRVNLLDNNVISLPNLYNKGICYNYQKVTNTNWNYSFKWITGTYQHTDNKSGIIDLSSQNTGGTYKCGYYGYRQLYSGSGYEYWTGYWYSAEGQRMLLQKLASKLEEYTDENRFYHINGNFNVEKVYHDTPKTQWAHHDNGDLHTYEDWDMQIGKSVLYNQALGSATDRYGLEQQIDWTNIKAEGLDVTHHCAVDKSTLQFGYGKIAEDNDENYVYIGGTVNQLKHTHHLADDAYYEYYLVPGSYTQPVGDAFNDEANGHLSGVNVTDYVTDFVPGQGKASTIRKSAELLNTGNSFNLLIPEKNLGGSNGNYTLYVKAKYNDDSELAPTFHALTPLGQPTTGVDDLVLDLYPASIEVVNGSIVISGSNGTAMVSTLSGVVVYQGGDATVDVAPGTYIVRAGGTASKVLVK